MEGLAWDSDPLIRRTAARGLVPFSAGPTEATALDGLRRLLRDPERCVRREAAGALELREWTGLPAEDRDRLTNPVLRPRRGEPEYGRWTTGARRLDGCRLLNSPTWRTAPI